VGQPAGDQLNNATAAHPQNIKINDQERKDTNRLRELATWRRLFLTARRLNERLALLDAFGLTDRDIAKAVPNATARSVRRWRTEAGGVPTTRLAERWEPVDDLCAIIGYFLADGSYDEESVVSWLRSRQPELGNQRPLDTLSAGDFHAVLEAAERSVTSSSAEEDEVVPLPRRVNRKDIPTRERA
jgi:hypothetical protein